MEYEYKGDAKSAYDYLKTLGYDVVIDTSDDELHMAFTKDSTLIKRVKMQGEVGAEQYEMYYHIRNFVLHYHAEKKAKEIAFRTKLDIGEHFSRNVSPVTVETVYTAEELLSWQQSPWCTGNPMPHYDEFGGR